MTHLTFPSACSVLLVAVTFAVAGCGGRIASAGATPQALVEVNAGREELVTSRAFLAGTRVVNTHDYVVGDKPRSDLVVRFVPRTDEGPGLWRSWDALGSFVDFSIDETTGLSITRAHNARYESWIEFDHPLVLAPPRLAVGEQWTQELGFETRAKGWPRQRGKLEMTSTFLGAEPIATFTGTVDDAVRLDSRWRLALPLGFGVVLEQRQWLSPTAGEVRRELDGSFGFAGMGLRRFTAIQILKATRPATDADRAAPPIPTPPLESAS